MPEIPLSILLLAGVFVAICFWLAGDHEELERIPWERAEPIDLAAERDAFEAARDRRIDLGRAA